MKKQLIMFTFLFISLISCKKEIENPKNFQMSVLTNTVWESSTQINTYNVTDGNVYNKISQEKYMFTYTLSGDILSTHTYQYVLNGSIYNVSLDKMNKIRISNDTLYADGNFIGKRKW